MNDSFYLIALGLISKNGNRAMPLNGKSIRIESSNFNLPNKEAEEISLELLLRVYSNDDSVSVSRELGDESLILAVLNQEDMVNKLPTIKSEWINTGNNIVFKNSIIELAHKSWKLVWNKEDRVHFIPLI